MAHSVCLRNTTGDGQITYIISHLLTTDDEIEEMRRDMLKRELRRRDIEIDDIDTFRRLCEPGMLGCHEALHVASIAEFIDDHLLQSQAALMNLDRYRLTYRSVEAMSFLYQLIDTAQLSVDGQASPIGYGSGPRE